MSKDATAEQKKIHNVFGLDVPKGLKAVDAEVRIDALRSDAINLEILKMIEGKRLPKFDDLMAVVGFDQIRARFLDVEKSWKNDSYTRSYRKFVAYFPKDRKISTDDLIIGASFTYAWMPTILEFKSTEFERCAELLTSVRDGKEIDTKGLKKIEKLVNNSIVGTSKLLHFVNPSLYAIWDSRVCNFLSCRSAYSYCDDIKKFEKYQELCRNISRHSEFGIINKRINELTGYIVSPIRAVEQIMFLSSHNPIVRDVILKLPQKDKTSG